MSRLLHGTLLVVLGIVVGVLLVVNCQGVGGTADAIAEVSTDVSQQTTGACQQWLVTYWLADGMVDRCKGESCTGTVLPAGWEPLTITGEYVVLRKCK